MIIAKVRRARKTGMNKKYNKKMAQISLDNKWIGERVFVIKESEFRTIKFNLNRSTKLLNKINLISKPSSE